MSRILLAGFFYTLWTTHLMASPMDELYSALEKQQSQLPITLSTGIQLTDIDVEPDMRKVIRHYIFDSLDFGKLNAQRAKQYSRGFLSELLQQCNSHQSLIYQENVQFEYSVRDMKGRLVLLEKINKGRCLQFHHYH